LFLGAFALPAESSTLNNVLLSKQDGEVAADVRFSCSFRYDRHEPRDAALQVEIDLIPVGQCSDFKPGEPLLEMLKPAGGDGVGLREVEFNSYGRRVYLAMRFDEPMQVSVSQPAGMRSIHIKLRQFDAQRVVKGAAALSAVPETTSSPQPSQHRASAMNEVRQHIPGETDPAGGAFAINLRTQKDSPIHDAAGANIAAKQLYTSVITVEGVEWHRLRLGFFTSESRAEAVLAELSADYPDAVIVRVDAPELAVAAANAFVPQEVPLPAASFSAQTAGPGLNEARLAELMAEARDQMLAEDYASAIQLYTKVLREGETRFTPEALEYLGLARERNGQQAHAVAEYRRYLTQYPAEEGAARVQQRLDGLLLSAVPRPKRADSTAMNSERREQSNWDVYGGIAQYYRRDVSDYDEQGASTTQSAILSDVDMLTRRRGERFDFATRMTFGNYYDLLSEEQGVGNDTRFYYLYADMADKDLGLSTRLGRQSMRTGGVLGRFDGAHVAWQFSPDWRVNLMGGEPVYSTSDRVESDRSFYGMSIDAFDVIDALDMSFYYNTQQVDGIDDREAIGGELRYFDERRSLVSLVDYDIGYNVLNSIVALGNWTFDNRLTLNATFDFRRSPYLRTESALIGQNVSTMDELLQIFTEDEVRGLAEDRSGELTTLTLGFSRPVYERFQINADITMSDYSGTEASENVPAYESLGADYAYNLSLVGSSLMKEGDVSIFTLRYLDGSNVSMTSASVDTRYPVTDRFRINPRLLLSYREYNGMDSSEWFAIPALRLFYQFRRRTRFEFELGGRWSDRETSTGSIGSSSWFLYTGYRTDF
jgi:hypothetical protein